MERLDPKRKDCFDNNFRLFSAFPKVLRHDDELYSMIDLESWNNFRTPLHIVALLFFSFLNPFCPLLFPPPAPFQQPHLAP